MVEGRNFWDRLDPKYRVILCDVWGVIHDGVKLYPGVARRLGQWRRDCRYVLLITNAPKTADFVELQLARLKLPRDCWDAIATSGEAGITALRALDAAIGFIGTLEDRAVIEGRGLRIAADDGFTDLACAGLEEARPRVADYGDDLQRWIERNVRMHCLNPDRVVVRGGIPELCAGAIADAYEALGGQVTWYGKPFKPIYAHALEVAGRPRSDAVLAIGDGLQTDMLGAARMGIDAVFVTGGVNGGAPFPEDFAIQHGLGDWSPVAVVDGLER
jgi:HAD superfamily hydrolase (TIGR01459 family)